MVERFRYATVTGPSSKFPEQRVGLDHELEDRDILTIITRR
ncbi:MAG: TGS domain-containing protein, partial [Candidatus Thermoplasmatota archaeon]|nr:TGS domain-containing protein [Candidatus Thermoplasmatota archaeon]